MPPQKRLSYVQESLNNDIAQRGAYGTGINLSIQTMNHELTIHQFSPS